MFHDAVEEERAFGHGFLFMPIFIGLGAIKWFSLPENPSFYQLVALACLFSAAFLLLRHSASLWRVVALGAFLFTLGMMLAAIETARLDTVLLDTPVTTTVRGTVVGREITDKGDWRYTVEIVSTAEPRLKRPPDTVTLLCRSKSPPIEIGGGIEGRARLSPPSGAALAGLNDFAFDSYFKGIGAVGYFYGTPRAVVLTNRDGSVANLYVQAQETIAGWREAIGTRIRATIGGDAGAIAAALVTAEERAISRPAIDALREAGLAHVLAISGLNMVLAAGTFLIGARTFLSLVPGLAHRFPIKKVAAAGALVMVCAYILISGGAVSAVRSWIMISIMLIAVFFDRPSISLRNVALSALVILIVTPSAVTGPGFQMSFAATLALVAGYGHWRERRRDGRGQSIPSGKAALMSGIGGFFGGLLLSSFIGGMSTMIYSAGHFHRLTAYGLLGNVLAMPIISILVMPFALIAMLLMPFGLDRYPLLVMGQGLDWMISIATMVSSWGGQITTGRIPDNAFLLISAGGVLACLFRTWLAISGFLVVAVGLAVAAGGGLPSPDIVISEDGRLVGLVAERVISTNRTIPADFIFSQWQRALRLEDPQKPVKRADLAVADPGTGSDDGKDGSPGRRAYRPPIDGTAARTSIDSLLAATPPGRFACVPKQWCGATTREGWVVVTVEDARFIGVACDVADLIVTPVMLRFHQCRSGKRLIDGEALRRTGALEIHADRETAHDGKSGMVIVSALSQLERPWARHRTYDWRTDSFVSDVTADALPEIPPRREDFPPVIPDE